MPRPNGLSRSLVALDQNSTVIAVVELSQSSWLVAGCFPALKVSRSRSWSRARNGCLPCCIAGGMRRSRPTARSRGWRWPRSRPRWLLAGALAQGAWARGARDPSLQCRGLAEHRRAKTDRLDTELLKRGFVGWLRGERGHCGMARAPTIGEEDAKRPNRERDCLVRERTRIVNRIKSTLARLGIRNFKPTLRKAADRLATVHTPGEHAAATEHLSRAPARHGAAGLCCQPDQRNRGSSSETIRAA